MTATVEKVTNEKRSVQGPELDHKYNAEIERALGDAPRFLRLTLSGPGGKGAGDQRISFRPVTIDGRAMIQISRRDGAREQVENVDGPAALAAYRTESGKGCRNLELQCTDMDLHVRLTRKGRALVRRSRPSRPAGENTPGHDRTVKRVFADDQSDPLLEALGIQCDGRVRSAMRAKFNQINHFLELFGHTALVREAAGHPVHIVDCGCGKAFLSLAALHHLRRHLGCDARLTGVDADETVIRAAGALCARAGLVQWVDLVTARIADWTPPDRVDAVFSLHACDTATDEALALGVRCSARLILSAPCCQHELHHQIDHPEFRALLRHGILRERQADLLTDALRAAALRIMGYRTDVIEFTGLDNTAKNLMIRAEFQPGMPMEQARDDYRSLRDFWKVTPSIERLLGDKLKIKRSDGASE